MQHNKNHKISIFEVLCLTLSIAAGFSQAKNEIR